MLSCSGRIENTPEVRHSHLLLTSNPAHGRTEKTEWSLIFIDLLIMTSFAEKALKTVSLVLNEFSQIENIEPKLTTHWHKKGEQLRNEWCIYDKS